MSAPQIEAIKIRVNIAGYGNQGEAPATVLCAFDPAAGRLLVADVRKMEEGGRAGWLLVTNQHTDQHCDAFFNPDMLRDSIAAFFSMESMGLVDIAKKAELARPTSKIESDGMDERGVKYRIKSDCGNRQVAVLAACWFANIQRGVGAALDDFDDLYGDVGGADDGDGAFTV
jgi:hypothetical protein